MAEATSPTTPDGDRAPTTEERLFTLLFAVLGAATPPTAADLYELPGYRSLRDAARKGAFQRDKDALRSAGIPISASGSDEGAVYVIDREALAAREPELAPEDTALLSRAVRAWADLSDDAATSLIHKLRARADLDIDPRLSLSLEGGQSIAPIIRAMVARQIVLFRYESLTTTEDRLVLPLRLEARAGALYLWGWDLDREAPRTFRLSRIKGRFKDVASKVSGMSEGEAMPDFSLDGDPFEDLTVAPLLAVRHGAAAAVRRRAAVVPDDAAGTAPRPGWDVLQGEADERGDWMELVLMQPSDVVVLEPAGFRQAVVDRLTAAAAWTGEDVDA